MELKKRSVCVLFGGDSPEYEVSLRSAEAVLNAMDPEKYNLFPVGITRQGEWILFAGNEYSLIAADRWQEQPGNRRAVISPMRGQGLLSFEGDCVVREWIDVVFPVTHGGNGENGTVQGLLELSGIPYVGPRVAASAVAMDKRLTKIMVEKLGLRQADWRLVDVQEWERSPQAVIEMLEAAFSYPIFIKPVSAGSSVGVSRAVNRRTLAEGLQSAAQHGSILAERCIVGREIEVAVMGNDNPVASVCGEIDTGAAFYDYHTKYISNSAVAYIPARIPEETAERIRDAAVRIYRAIGCCGMSRLDFFVNDEDGEPVFNEINTLPGFTTISMYPKLFAASGIPMGKLIDQLLQLAQEAFS